MPQIPDLPGPLASAYVEYDTGSFDLANPAHAPFIPPLANLQPKANGCDPHGRQAFIPASIAQVLTFFDDAGILNYCTGPGGVCDTVASPGAPAELEGYRRERLEPDRRVTDVCRDDAPDVRLALQDLERSRDRIDQPRVCDAGSGVER